MTLVVMKMVMMAGKPNERLCTYRFFIIQAQWEYIDTIIKPYVVQTVDPA